MTIDEAIKYLSNPLSWAIGKTLEQQIADNKEATQMAIDALEQAKTNCSEFPNNWIPCSVKLPEDDTEVLVYLFENNKSPYIAWLSDGRWYTEYFEVEREDEPVAWMPLPEPYKGEQE